MKRKAQVTIWIIVAVLIAASILIFFAIKERQGTEISQPSTADPQAYIEKCMRDASSEAINIMLPQAGYISPENYKLYENNKVAYLCYNKNYYYSCVNQQPNYLNFLENEIRDYIEPKMKDCFYNLKQEYLDKKYSVNEGVMFIDVKIVPKQVNIEIENEFEVSKQEETRRYDEFKARLNSPLFELANVAREIVNQEAKYCNFEYLGYMLFYPMFNIDKKSVGSAETASKIYMIADRNTDKRLYIAIRSCAIPPGF